MKLTDRIFMIAIFCVLFLLFAVCLFGRFVFPKESDGIIRYSVDWLQQYPHKDRIAENGVLEPSASVTTEEKGLMSKLIEEYTSITEKFNQVGFNGIKKTSLYSGILQKGFAFQSVLTDSDIVNGRLKLKNDYWVTISQDEIDKTKAETMLTDYLYLQRYLNNQGIDFVYIQAPLKESFCEGQTPYLADMYINEDQNIYIQIMEKLGINYIDVEAELKKENLDFYSFSYKTDHHWNVDGAKWATSLIINSINAMGKYHMEDSDSFGTYSRKTYDKAMFGSQGVAVTHAIEESEDFSILFPNFDTDLRVEVPNGGVDKVGTFEEVMVDYDFLDIMIKKDGGYAYESLLYENRPFVKITNYKNPDGPKIFIIKDSFGLAVIPYLSLSCSEIVAIDVRPVHGTFDGSVISCIEQFDPDIVLNLTGEPSNIGISK